jgi:hypothetical protein
LTGLDTLLLDVDAVEFASLTPCSIEDRPMALALAVMWFEGVSIAEASEEVTLGS